MGLEAIQRFITCYLRDESYRERFARLSATSPSELGLDPDDLKVIDGINLEDLARAASRIRMERFGKRRAEFEQAMVHFGAYTDLESFFTQYDRTFATGLLSRPMEMERFISFATEWVMSHGLPEYLIDLLRFGYHVTKLADAPPVVNERVLDTLPTYGIRPFHRVELRRPWRIVEFRYDVLAIAGIEQPTADVANYIRMTRTQLFIQKDVRLFKRTQIYYAHNMPLLEQLNDEPQSVLELVSSAPNSEFNELIEQLRFLHERSVVNLWEPPGVTD